MIDWLHFSKTAHFYRKRRRLSKVAVTELFRALRQNHRAPSNNIFHHIKEPLARAHWSAISFSYETDPAFLEAPAGQVRERIFGFILLVEYKDFVVIFKSAFELPTTFKSEFLDRVGNDRVEHAIARTDTTFEQIRLRNMATSKYALRSKTLEANDLQSVVGPSGASRFVPQGYRVRRGADQYSASPSTGRISMRSDKSGYEDLVRWSILVAERLGDQNQQTSAFIRTFARPINLADLPKGVNATYLAINVAALTDELFESDDPKRLIRRSDAGVSVLQKGDIDVLISALDQSFSIRIYRGDLIVSDPRNNGRVGTIAIGKTRISLRAFELPEMTDIFIEPAIGPPGQGDDCTLLKRYVDQNDLFTVLFSDFALAYIDGTLYRDDLFAEGGETFLRYIRSDALLNGATSEKGNFTPALQSFEANSVFRAIVDNIANGDEVLICDDLGDEWADFVGLNCVTNPKRITFYHAKHGAISLGASPFHVAVSQAIKNLGRMTLPADAVAAKLPRWSNTYANDHVQTQIPRLIRGQVGTLSQTASEARLAPDTIRRVFIVTSSLSKHQLEQTFASIRAGQAPTPHFVQLYWLLMSYFSACAEVGAFAYIVCRE